MDMKRILQALDGASSKPVEGANEMARFLRAVSETAPPAIKVPEVPALPAQDGDQGDGSMLKTNADGTKSYSGAWGTFIYDKSGKAVKYTTPNFDGYGQTIDLANSQTTQNYNQGPLSLSQTTDASGKQVGSNAEYTMGNVVATQQKDASGQATNTVTPVQENSLNKFLSIVDKNDVGILMEGANPHKVTLPVQMAMQHYQKPVQAVAKKQSLGISKYFHKVEEELAEEKAQRRQVLNQYAQTIADRVLIKEAANPAQQAAIAISKKKEQKADESLKTDNPCWKGYKPVGTKKKGGKTVPNCVPTNENEIPGHSMGFTGGVGPGMGNYVVDEAPLDFDKNSPMSSTIHSHKGVNPASIEVRIMRARRQLQELAKMAGSDDALAWQHIARLFPELAMNIEQIDHGLRQLGSIRQKGGRNSKNIPQHLDPAVNETVLNPIKPKVASAPKAIKPKTKTSTCRAGQTQTGMQIKNGKSVPKCSVTGIKK